MKYNILLLLPLIMSCSAQPEVVEKKETTTKTDKVVERTPTPKETSKAIEETEKKSSVTKEEEAPVVTFIQEGREDILEFDVDEDGNHIEK